MILDFIRWHGELFLAEVVNVKSQITHGRVWQIPEDISGFQAARRLCYDMCSLKEIHTSSMDFPPASQGVQITVFPGQTIITLIGPASDLLEDFGLSSSRSRDE